MSRRFHALLASIVLFGPTTLLADEPQPKPPAVPLPGPMPQLPPGYRWISPNAGSSSRAEDYEPPAWLKEQLAKTKVPTVKDAQRIAARAVPPTSGIYDAISSSSIVGVFQLGRKVANFGEEGDLVWDVRILRKFAITQELWISSSTGHVRKLLPEATEE